MSAAGNPSNVLMKVAASAVCRNKKARSMQYTLHYMPFVQYQVPIAH